jgi:hypothetical protein
LGWRDPLLEPAHIANGFSDKLTKATGGMESRKTLAYWQCVNLPESAPNAAMYGMTPMQRWCNFRPYRQKPLQTTN